VMPSGLGRRDQCAGAKNCCARSDDCDCKTIEWTAEIAERQNGRLPLPS
jgi:hypothetical protein